MDNPAFILVAIFFGAPTTIIFTLWGTYQLYLSLGFKPVEHIPFYLKLVLGMCISTIASLLYLVFLQKVEMERLNDIISRF